jgi:hypothetical protein
MHRRGSIVLVAVPVLSGCGSTRFAGDVTATSSAEGELSKERMHRVPSDSMA